jgi:hypothetical protein
VNKAYLEGLYYHHLKKNGNPSRSKIVEMEGVYNYQFKPRSRKEWILIWKFLIQSSNHLYVKESFLIIFMQLMEAF